MAEDDATKKAEDFDPKATRKEIKDHFREGNLPSGADFAQLIDEMALEGDYKDLKEIKPGIKDMAKLAQETGSHSFGFAFGMPGRFGTFAKDAEFDRIVEIAQVGASTTIPIVAKTEPPFAFEVLAYLESANEEDANNSIMMHSIAMHTGTAFGEQTLRVQNRFPAALGITHRTFGISSALSGVAVFLLTLLYLGSLDCMGSEPPEICTVIWDQQAFLTFLWEQVTNLGEGTQGLLGLSLGLLLLGLYNLRPQRKKLHLNWNASSGLSLKAKPLKGTQAAELRYHITRLY